MDDTARKSKQDIYSNMFRYINWVGVNRNLSIQPIDKAHNTKVWWKEDECETNTSVLNSHLQMLQKSFTQNVQVCRELQLDFPPFYLPHPHFNQGLFQSNAVGEWNLSTTGLLWFWNNKTPFCPNSIRREGERDSSSLPTAPYTYPRGSQSRPGMFALPLHQTGCNAFHMWEKKGGIGGWRREEGSKRGGMKGDCGKSGVGADESNKEQRQIAADPWFDW